VIAKEMMLWALRKRRPWRVQGTSMEPDYVEGDLVLINPDAAVVPGVVVVARHPYKHIDIIKYVELIDEDDQVELRSPSGSDSRQFGRTPRQSVKGVVTYNWKRSRT